MFKKFNFNDSFGLKWRDRFDRTLTLFCFVSVLLIYSTIAIVANLNYSKIKDRKQDLIFEHYRRLISDLIVQTEGKENNLSEINNSLSLVSPTIITDHISTTANRLDRRKVIDAQMATQGILNPGIQTDPYADLPDLGSSQVDIAIDEPVMIELSRRSAYSRVQMPSYEGVTNYNVGEYDEPFRELYNYVIKRQGNVYIHLTPELLKEEQIEYGYRDPEEIQRVISNYQPMVEYCFKKGLNLDAGLSGYVKIQFNISYEGFVIPESIRVLRSTLRNKQVEHCIKNYIKRWRNFERLDETMGIARVIQKFIFN